MLKELIKGLLYTTVTLVIVGGIVLAQDDPPSAPPSDAPPPITTLAYEADFSDTSVWTAGADGDQLTYGPAAEGYQIVSLGEGGIGIAPAPAITTDNFYTEFTFTLNTCPSTASALLFFVRLQATAGGASQADGYVFVLQCDGQFRARSVSGGAPGSIDTQGTLTERLALDIAHTMGILFEGNTVSWYLNGSTVATFEASAVRSSGQFAPGAQLGLDYTVTRWRIWDVTSTDDTASPVEGDDLLSSIQVGEVLYEPSILPPSGIQYGLHYPIARLVTGNAISMYNTLPVGIMPFEGVDGRNYLIEIEFAVRTCSETSLIGLYWRASSNLATFYAAGIQCDGKHRVREVGLSGASTPLLEGQLSQPLEPRILNVITLAVKDEQAAFYFNQDFLGSFAVDTLISGGAGLILQSGEDGKAMDIVVTRLRVTAIR